MKNKMKFVIFDDYITSSPICIRTDFVYKIEYNDDLSATEIFLVNGKSEYVTDSVEECCKRLNS